MEIWENMELFGNCIMHSSILCLYFSCCLHAFLFSWLIFQMRPETEQRRQCFSEPALQNCFPASSSSSSSSSSWYKGKMFWHTSLGCQIQSCVWAPTVQRHSSLLFCLCIWLLYILVSSHEVNEEMLSGSFFSLWLCNWLSRWPHIPQHTAESLYGKIKYTDFAVTANIFLCLSLSFTWFLEDQSADIIFFLLNKSYEKTKTNNELILETHKCNNY